MSSGLSKFSRSRITSMVVPLNVSMLSSILVQSHQHMFATK